MKQNLCGESCACPTMASVLDKFRDSVQTFNNCVPDFTVKMAKKENSAMYCLTKFESISQARPESFCASFRDN